MRDQYRKSMVLWWQTAVLVLFGISTARGQGESLAPVLAEEQHAATQHIA